MLLNDTQKLIFESNLIENGFQKTKTPNMFNQYEYIRGSIANNIKIHLGSIIEVSDPLGDLHTAVFVNYERESEAGEDLCDFHTTDKRYVTVDKLQEYFKDKGIRFSEFMKNIDLEETMEEDIEK